MNHSDVVAVGVGGCCCWSSVAKFSDDFKLSEAGPGGMFPSEVLVNICLLCSCASSARWDKTIMFSVIVPSLFTCAQRSA